MNQPPHDPTVPSRRAFLKTTPLAATALGLSAATSAASAQAVGAKEATSPATTPEATAAPAPSAEPEWRNRQPDVTYRMLGRTGYMVSEVVLGGYPITADNVELYEQALDRGINLLDQAASYGQGAGERSIAALLRRGVDRDRFFLTTKLSHYNGFVRNVYGEHFKTLSGDRQQEIQQLAEELLNEHDVLKPGYHVSYFDGQERPLDGAYIARAMKQLGIAAGTKALFKTKLADLLNESLSRTTADHFDILYCPHSVESPDGFDDEALLESLADFRQQGKARSFAFSCHNDPANNLIAGAAAGIYDVAMIAYNMVNFPALDPAIAQAAAAGVGVIAMKAARPVWNGPNATEPKPAWRAAKLNAMIPGDDLTIIQKAYLFALQNPNLSAVIAEMTNQEMMDQNLSLMGRKVELQPV